MLEELKIDNNLFRHYVDSFHDVSVRKCWNVKVDLAIKAVLYDYQFYNDIVAILFLVFNVLRV